MKRFVSILILLYTGSLILAKSTNSRDIEILRDGGKIEKKDNMEAAESGAIFLHKFGRGKRSILEPEIVGFDDIDVYINPINLRSRRSAPKQEDMETAENGAVFLHKFGRGKRSIIPADFEVITLENIDDSLTTRSKRSTSKKEDMESAENGAVFLHKFGRGKRSTPEYFEINNSAGIKIPLYIRNKRSDSKQEEMETAENGAVFLHKFGRGKRSISADFDMINIGDTDNVLNKRNKRSAPKEEDMETAENGAVFLHKFGRGKRSIIPTDFEIINLKNIIDPLNTRSKRSAPKKEDMDTAENGAVFLHKFGRGKRSIQETQDLTNYVSLLSRNERSAPKNEEMDIAETIFLPSFGRNSYYGRRRFGRSVEAKNENNFENDKLAKKDKDSTIEIDTAETVFLPSFSRNSGRRFRRAVNNKNANYYKEELK